MSARRAGAAPAPSVPLFLHSRLLLDLAFASEGFPVMGSRRASNHSEWEKLALRECTQRAGLCWKPFSSLRGRCHGNPHSPDEQIEAGAG